MSVFNRNHAARDDVAAVTSLLKGQLAAVESYDQVINRFEDPHLVADLEAIREDHIQAKAILREKVEQLGGPSVESPGPWCACAAADEARLSPVTALAALHQGEEQAVIEFENSLKIDGLDADCKNLIRTKLLPGSRTHVAELDRLMGGIT